MRVGFLLKQVWRGWARFTHFLGSLIGFTCLFLVYWIVLTPFALIVKSMSKPMDLKAGEAPTFKKKEKKILTIDDMRKPL